MNCINIEDQLCHVLYQHGPRNLHSSKVEQPLSVIAPACVQRLRPKPPATEHATRKTRSTHSRHRNAPAVLVACSIVRFTR
jgi:hypothetical protein